ncbi:MAG: SHOCT domain-containing protein [Methanomassiliicoccales archaeon]|jgi:putative membrane protein
MDERPRRIIGVIIGALIILLLGVLLIEIIINPSNFWRNDGSFYFPWWILGFIFILLFIGFIFRMVFWTFIGFDRSGRDFNRYRHWHGRYWEYPERGAEHILDERYAKGEITREQYQQILDDIRKGKQQGGMP